MMKLFNIGLKVLLAYNIFVGFVGASPLMETTTDDNDVSVAQRIMLSMDPNGMQIWEAWMNLYSIQIE